MSRTGRRSSRTKANRCNARRRARVVLDCLLGDCRRGAPAGTRNSDDIRAIIRGRLSIVSRARTPTALRTQVRGSVGPRDRLAVHRPFDHPVAGDQYLSADLGDPAFLHQLQVNLPNAPLRFVGLDNYIDILTDEDVWQGMQVTARFVICTIALQTLIGFGLALLINRQFSRPQLLDHNHPVADDAVARGRGQFLDVSFPAANRPFQLHRLFLHRHSAVLVPDDWRRRPWRRGRSSSSTPGCGRPT